MNYIYTYIQDAASRVHNFLRFESSNVLQLEVSRAFLIAFQERLAQNVSRELYIHTYRYTYRYIIDIHIGIYDYIYIYTYIYVYILN